MNLFVVAEEHKNFRTERKSCYLKVTLFDSQFAKGRLMRVNLEYQNRA